MSVRKIVTISLIVAVFVLVWVYRGPLMDSLHWFGNPNAIMQSIKGYGLWGVAVLCGLFALQSFIAFIPGLALTLASGYIYGFVGGLLIAWTSLVVAGQIAFWLARRFGRPLTEKWVSPRLLDRWDKSAAGQGIGFYIFTLVLPFFPNDAMCYVAGLSKISFHRFLVANMVGRGLACLFTVFVGAYAMKVPALPWIAGAVFIALGIAGWIIARIYNSLVSG
jgi:uncharacterized membrane protein YdjX (TVP38/TMEM64 family)